MQLEPVPSGFAQTGREVMAHQCILVLVQPQHLGIVFHTQQAVRLPYEELELEHHEPFQNAGCSDVF